MTCVVCYGKLVTSLPSRGGTMTAFEVPDELWERITEVLPVRQRRYRWPGRKPLNDRACLNGILFVLVTGINWGDLPQQLGYGSGMTCWRRLRDWQAAGVWDQLHALLLADLHAADQIDWSRVVVDGSHVRAKRGTLGRRSGQARSTVAGRAPSTTC